MRDDIIKLVPLIESDFDELLNVASDPLVWEQHPARDRYKPEVFKLYFDGAIEGNAAFKIIDIATNKTIGSSRFYYYKPDVKSIAIGFTFLAKEYWGGRYNRSSKKLLMDYAFQFVDNIYFHIGSTNLRSQKAIEKIGATKTREVDFDSYGKKILHFEYLVSKKDWERSSD